MRSSASRRGLRQRYSIVATAGRPAGAPNIFTALRDQLGLKLETGKGLVDVIIIDHLQRPTLN